MLHKLVLSNPKLRKLVPQEFKRLLKSAFFSSEYELAVWQSNNPYCGTSVEWGTDQFNSNVKIGILYDPAHYHRYYISACLDLKLDFEVINILGNKWIEKVEQSKCDALVVWPHLNNLYIKDAFDERIYLLEHVMGKLVYPRFYDIYLLDNKRRVRDWLMAHHLPIPETNCFYSRQEAEQFLQETSYPVVSKTVRGSVARGVHILRSREEASRLVKQVFGRGIVPHNMDPRMIQWDFILFQEYLPEVREQRMIRIGKSYLAINKVIRGDFHSGSGTMLWAKPDDEVLNLTKRISDMGGFESMNVDFFLAQDGRVLVNELHPLFHGPEILVEDLKGRYLFNESLDSWAFEAGNYYRNYCCNLRLINVLDMLNETPNWDWLVKPAFGLANIPN